MRRRDFISFAGSAAAAWPFTARAQLPDRVPKIGFLGPDAANWSAWTAAFAERVGQLDWIDGQTVAIDYRWSEGSSERVADIGAEFARQKVDVVVTYGGAVTALRQVTPVTPIVVVVSNDPFGSGLVTSLSRPGGNTCVYR